jgi:hypothetical protein
MEVTVDIIRSRIWSPNTGVLKFCDTATPYSKTYIYLHPVIIASDMDSINEK